MVGNGVVGVIVVGQDQGVPIVLVPEEVVDTFLFQQPAGEIEISLPILHAVIPAMVRLDQEFLEVGVAVFAEDVFDDVRSGPALENAAVAGASKKPEPGDQGGLVEGKRPVEADMGKQLTMPSKEWVW